MCKIRLIPQQIQALVVKYPDDGMMRLYARFDDDVFSTWRYVERRGIANAVSHLIGQETFRGIWALGYMKNSEVIPILTSAEVDADTRDWVMRRHIDGKGW
jgi:hypothetical protein